MEYFAEFSPRAFASAASDERVRLRRALDLALSHAIEGNPDFHDAIAAIIPALRAVGHELRPVATDSSSSTWCPVDESPHVFGLFVWFARPRTTASWARLKGLAHIYAEGGVARLADELARGADPNECDPLGVPIVCDAAAGNDVNALRLLLDRGVDLESSCRGTTPLIYAANAGHVEAVRFLLSRGANRRATNDEGYTAAGRVSGRHHALLALLSGDD